MVTVGDPAGLIGVTLILPALGMWTWTGINDGVSCAIKQYSSSAIEGSAPGGGGNRMVFTVSGTVSMDAIYCTDPSPSGGLYIRASGFAVKNTDASATFANGIVHVQKTYDQTTFTNIFAQNTYGDVWHVEGTCCGTSFYNVQGISTAATGGYPLTVGKTGINTSDTVFYGSTFNYPGNTKYDIFVTGGNYTRGINFHAFYGEGNGATDSTSPMVYVDSSVGTVRFYGGELNTEQVSSTKYAIENHGKDIQVYGTLAINTTNGINDVTTGNTVAPINRVWRDRRAGDLWNTRPDVLRY